MALLLVNATGFCSFIRGLRFTLPRPGVMRRRTVRMHRNSGPVFNPLPKPCRERRIEKHPPFSERPAKLFRFCQGTAVVLPPRSDQAFGFQGIMDPSTLPHRRIREA